MFKIETIKVKGDAEKAARAGIKKQGPYREIGSGAYGQVYGHKNSNIVFKLGDYNDNEGYLAYIREIAKSKTHNPFTPIIYGMWIFDGEDRNTRYNKYFVVAMERLESPYKHRGYYAAVNWFEDIVGDYTSETNHEQRALRKFFGINNVPVRFPKPLTELLRLLRRARNKSSTDWDIHEGNFMMRGKQLVVIDPLA